MKRNTSGEARVSAGVTPGGYAATNVPPATSDRGILFTALSEQLGLRLEAARGPVEFLVIDSVERPSTD